VEEDPFELVIVKRYDPAATPKGRLAVTLVFEHAEVTIKVPLKMTMGHLP
jgi:hypothetical protein